MTVKFFALIRMNPGWWLALTFGFLSFVRRDNQGENPATIRMRMRRCWGDEGRAEPDRRRPSSGGVRP